MPSAKCRVPGARSHFDVVPVQSMETTTTLYHFSMKLTDLLIHKQSIELATALYHDVRSWPHFDRNTLGVQLVRAADSVPSNIAEGYGRYSRSDAKRFLLYARGSLAEVESHVRLACQRGLITNERLDELLAIIEPLMIRIKAFGRTLSDTRS